MTTLMPTQTNRTIDTSALLPVKQYLTFEATTVDQRPIYEYDGSRAVEREDSSLAHMEITTNLIVTLLPQIRLRQWRAGGPTLRVRTNTSYRYPDIVAYCPPAQFTDERPPSLLNPMLLVEVLSETTANTDLSLKLKEYTSIESVREYWIAAQDAPVIYRYVRAPEAWMVHLYEGLDVAFTSEALELSIRLADVYEGVDFTPTPPGEPA